MRPYAQYCPTVRAVEVLGERWTLLIVRDMLIGARRFNELARGLPGISRALLSRRLRQLEAAGIVRRADDGYDLTPAGEDLRPVVMGLAEWGARHVFGDPRPDELDPELLMWWMHGRIDTTEVDRRAVVMIDMVDARRLFWLVIEPEDVSICDTDPGFEVDAVLKGHLTELLRMWSGDSDLLSAVRDGRLELAGARWIVRGLPRWFQYSPLADQVRAAQVRAAQAIDA